jgi:WD40 repeat protein
MALDAWTPNARVGDYLLLERLGAGGMGEVFLARHSATGGHYAIKALTDLGNAEAALRFQREAHALAAAEGHPNLGRVHSVGQAAGRMFLVLEHLPGGTLQQRLASGPLPPLEAASLVADLAAGVAHAHSRGIVHRDLKPENVIFDERGAPKVVDFGLASLRGSDALTKTGAVLGTPSYMAPEQARADKDAIDERCDVYALGAILYHCLTGRPPFAGPTVYATLEAVISRPPERPSQLRQGIPPALDDVCLRALAKRPALRPASARALRELLVDLDARAPARRWPLVAGLGAALSVGLGLALAWSPAEAPPLAAKPAPTPRVTGTAPPTPAPPAPLYRLRHPAAKASALGAAFVDPDQLVTWGDAAEVWRWDLTLAPPLVGGWTRLGAVPADVVVDGFPTLLAAPAESDQLERWVLATGEQLRPYKLPFLHSSALALSPDATLLAIAQPGQDSSGIPVMSLGATRHERANSYQASCAGAVTDVALSSRHLVAAIVHGETSTTGEVRVWRGEEEQWGQALPRAATAVAVAPDGLLAAVGDDLGQLHLVDLPPDSVPALRLSAPPPLNGPVSWVGFLPARPRILLAVCAEPAGGPELVVWDLTTTPAREVLTRPGAGLVHVALAPDASRLALTSVSGEVEVWDTRDLLGGGPRREPAAEDLARARRARTAHELRRSLGTWWERHDGHPLADQVAQLEVLRFEEEVTWGGGANGAAYARLRRSDGDHVLVDLGPGGGEWPVPRAHRRALGLSPDGTRWACSGDDGSLVRVLGGEDVTWTSEVPWTLAWSPDSRLVAVADTLNLFLIDALSGERVWTQPCRYVAALCFDPSGQRLAVARTTADCLVELRDVTGGEVQAQSRFQHKIFTLNFSHTGDYLACGDNGGRVFLLPGRGGPGWVGRALVTEEGDLASMPPAHGGEVGWLAFLPGDRRLVSLGRQSEDSPDWELLVWDLPGGYLVRRERLSHGLVGVGLDDTRLLLFAPHSLHPRPLEGLQPVRGGS